MTTKAFNKQQAVEYFVDCLGYSEEEAKELAEGPELFEHIKQIIEYNS